MNTIDKLISEGKDPLDAVFHTATPEELASEQERDLTITFNRLWERLSRHERHVLRTLIERRTNNAVKAERERLNGIALTLENIPYADKSARDIARECADVVRTFVKSA